MAHARIELDEQYRHFISPEDPGTYEEWRAPLVEVPDDLLEAYMAAVETEYTLRRRIIDTCGTSYGDDD